MSLGRVVNSLLHHVTHKNTAYRTKVAMLADYLIEKHGTAVSDRCCFAYFACVKSHNVPRHQRRITAMSQTDDTTYLLHSTVVSHAVSSLTGTSKECFKRQPRASAATARRRRVTAVNAYSCRSAPFFRSGNCLRHRQNSTALPWHFCRDYLSLMSSRI